VNEFVQNVRQEPHIIMKLSEVQIQSLLDQHLRQSLDDDEERRVSADRIDRDDLDDELETISFIKSDIKEELSLKDYQGMILLSKSGHQESEEYNHFWRCSVWERNAISIQKSIKLKRSA
jgi:hypothetical protein